MFSVVVAVNGGGDCGDMVVVAAASVTTVVVVVQLRTDGRKEGRSCRTVEGKKEKKRKSRTSRFTSFRRANFGAFLHEDPAVKVLYPAPPPPN